MGNTKENMKHIILTRFNLVFENWKNDRNNNPILSKEWLEERFELFKNYCFPSVKKQSNQEFVWVVFFDVATPHEYLSVITELQDSYDNFLPLYIDGNKSVESTLLHYIEQNFDGEDFILTTRIDNDDILHCDFVKTVQDIARQNYIHNLVIDVRKGYQMVLCKSHEEYRVCLQNFNPFISLLQKKELYSSIFARQHPDWKNEKNIVVHDRKPLWIQIIHQRNKVNRVNRHNRLVNFNDYLSFGFTKKKRKRGLLYINTYNSLIKIYEKFRN